jgi:hypothetical protein
MPARRHGLSRKSRAYKAWMSMNDRCNNPRAVTWEEYRNPPIKICPRWDVFENFYADMGECPSGMALERKDAKGLYEPGNCRWVSKKDRARNTSRSRFLTYNDKTQTLAAWCEERGIDRRTLSNRLKNKDWPMDKILTPGSISKKMKA